MRYASAILGILLVTVLVGCERQPSRSDYIETHQDGIRTLRWARQMDEHYGRDNVDHFITHYGLRGEPLTWNSEAHVGGRFILTMQVPVLVDYSTNSVTSAGHPKFFLHAISRIDQLPDGRYSASYASVLQRHFDEPHWNQFVNDEFSLTVLDIPEVEQHPVDRFDQYVEAVRSPRWQIPKEERPEEPANTRPGS